MKICPNCAYNEADNTTKFCQRCGASFSNMQKMVLIGESKTNFNKAEKNNSYSKNNDYIIADKKLILLIIADIILILALIPLYSLLVNNVGIMVYLLAILIMIGITVKVTIAKYSEGASKGIPGNEFWSGTKYKQSDKEDDKALETGFLMNAIKPKF